MGTDGAAMAPWVRRAVEAADGALLDRLTASLADELRASYAGTAFDVVRRGDNLLVAWDEGPRSDEVADHLDVDPALASGEAEVGGLYGEDLPDELRTVTVVLRRSDSPAAEVRVVRP